MHELRAFPPYARHDLTARAAHGLALFSVDSQHCIETAFRPNTLDNLAVLILALKARSERSGVAYESLQDIIYDLPAFTHSTRPRRLTYLGYLDGSNTVLTSTVCSLPRPRRSPARGRVHRAAQQFGWRRRPAQGGGPAARPAGSFERRADRPAGRDACAASRARSAGAARVRAWPAATRTPMTRTRWPTIRTTSCCSIAIPSTDTAWPPSRRSRASSTWPAASSQ